MLHAPCCCRPNFWRYSAECAPLQTRSANADNIDVHSSSLQLYIKGEFVGGSDILMGLHKSGDLHTLLSDGPKEYDSA